MFFSTARLVRNSDSAIAALDAPVATPASTSRSRVESRESSEFFDAHPRLDQHVHDLGVDHRAAGRNLADRLHQLDAVPDVLLQQVGPSGRAVLEELQRVVRADVLADHDDADLGMALPQRRRGLDALVGVRRGHSDVRDHDIGPVLLDGT